MLDRLALLPLPTLRGERVILRRRRDSDIDDQLRHPIDPEENDNYGSNWRRTWDGRRYHTREYLEGLAAKDAEHEAARPGAYSWAVEFQDRCVGYTALGVNTNQHRAVYSIGLFEAGVRGQGLGREITRLVLAWAFDELGAHRVELEVLPSNHRAIACYLACGFRREGVRREAELYPDGWKDFISMGVLKSEHAPAAR